MNKAKKLSELLDVREEGSDDALSVIAKLLKFATGSERYKSVNPYTIPVVRDSLKFLAKQSGMKNVENDYFDVDLDKFIKG